MTKNNIEVSPEHIHWFNYVLKIWNTSTNEVFYKDGKANKVGVRESQWNTKLDKINNLSSTKYVDGKWVLEVIWTRECTYYDEKNNCVYFMTRNKSGELFGNDSDDIVRELLHTHRYTIGENRQYSIYLDGEFFSDEGVLFKEGTTDEEIINMCNKTIDDWISGLGKDSIAYKVTLDKSKTKVCDFDAIAYAYQKKISEDIIKKFNTCINESIEVKAIMGSGKTHIANNIMCHISKNNDYNPVLLISGIKKVGDTFREHCEYTYNGGQKIHHYNITDMSVSQILDELKKDRENHIVPQFFLTCQSTRVRKNRETTDEEKVLTKIIFELLKNGVRFCVIITDEAHKHIFGSKTVDIYDSIRKFHTDGGLNIIHFTGTGFSLIDKINPTNLLEIDENDVEKEQHHIGEEFGGSDVNLHYIVSNSPKMLEYIDIDKKACIRYLMGKGEESLFNDTDNINTISPFRNGFNTPCVALWMEGIQGVKDMADAILDFCSEESKTNPKYSDYLVITANGYNGSSVNDYAWATKDSGFKVISPDFVTGLVNKYHLNGHPVFLVNYNKFSECWTLLPLNIEFILRNVDSADTAFQLFHRCKRPYVTRDEDGNVISVNKKDAFVFTFGETFYNVVHKAFAIRCYRNKVKGKNGKQDDYKNAMSHIFSKTSYIHIDGITYSHKNINDLRDYVEDKYLEREKSVIGFVSTLVTELPSLLGEFNNLLKENPDLKDYMSKLVGNNSQRRGEGSGTSKKKSKKSESIEDICEHECVKNYLVTFIEHLKHYKLTRYTIFDDMVSYDNLVDNGLLKDPISNHDIDFVKQLNNLINETSESVRDAFKHKVEFWIHKMTTEN